MDSWHEFYLMAGTAAVTLAGLLFVALSIHVDALVHEEREHLVGLARVTLFAFTAVLILSLMMLVPHQSLKLVAAEMMIVGVNFSLWTLKELRWRPKHHDPGFSIGVFRRRTIFPLVGYGLIGFSGLGLFITHEAEMMYFAIGAICMLLGNASGSSWDLLIRVARMKRDANRA
jgi:hypothetical protein